MLALLPCLLELLSESGPARLRCGVWAGIGQEAQRIVKVWLLQAVREGLAGV